MAKAKPKTTKKSTTSKKTTATTNRGWLYLLLMAAGAAMVVVVWYFVAQWQEQEAIAKADAAIYSAYGVAMPAKYGIHGIDVSRHQSTIAWKKVASMNVANVKIGFAFIKATEGIDDVDKNFDKNYHEAKKAGMVRGAYHFFLPNKDGKAQAQHFLDKAQLSSGDFPPVIDIEQLYGTAPAVMKKRLQDCIAVLEEAYKVKPIIYSYVDFYEHYLGKDFNAYPLWIAHYDEPEKPRIARTWIFWQHSEEAHVNGITTPVDCNVFNGDSSAFKQLLLK